MSTCLRAPLTSWTAVLVAIRLEESWKTRQPRLDLVGVAFPAPRGCGEGGTAEAELVSGKERGDVCTEVSFPRTRL